MKLKTTKTELIKRLKSEKELLSFVNKVENLFNWANDNPENSDNRKHSEDKETVRAHLAAAWEGF